jgi:NAD(P)-dependent dehydrogenase (short-subunit alcohol dehydrogenase family)
MQKVFAPSRVALITGGASGIGKAVALKCAKHLMKVCLADVDAVELKNVHEELQGAGAVAVISMVCDVTKLCDYEALSKRVYGEFGEVAFLFLNAGIAAGSSAYSTPIEEWKLCLEVNVWGVINGLHVFTPKMIKQKTVSKIVATSSLSGLINSAPATGVPYVVSKHSVTLIMESLQHELRKSEATRHVSSHLLLPGIIRTGITENSRRSVRSYGVTESQTIGLTDEQLQRMDSKDLAKYKKVNVTKSNTQRGSMPISLRIMPSSS